MTLNRFGRYYNLPLKINASINILPKLTTSRRQSSTFSTFSGNQLPFLPLWFSEKSVYLQSWICMFDAWIYFFNHLPNRGLVLIYHGRIRKNSLKQIQENLCISNSNLSNIHFPLNNDYGRKRKGRHFSGYGSKAESGMWGATWR